MKLKYLTLCLFGLSFSGCTQYVTKPNLEKNQALEQRATNAVNSIFESPSYDFTGQFKIQTELKQQKETKSTDVKKKQDQLDSEIKSQIDKALKSLNVKLSAKEKSELYKTIAEKNDPYAYLTSMGSEGSSKSKFTNGLSNLLNDLQFSYDGSVHYRQKIASLNLNVKYQKPTLLVQAQVPMVVDFKDYKFYTNYFALMPYLVNKDNQASYAYLDFSKYKSEFEKTDIKKFVDYLKQINALPYELASSQQVSTQTLTSQEKQNGISEKIRLKSDLETLLLQVSLYEWVNKPYIKQEIFGGVYDPNAVDEASAEEETVSAADEATQAAEEATRAAAAAGDYENYDHSDQAYESAVRVRQLISEELHRNMYHSHDENYGSESEAEASAYASACATCTADTAVADADSEYALDATAVAEDVEEVEASEALSYEACEALVASKQKVPFGVIGLCQNYYGIDLLSKDEREVELEDSESKRSLDSLKAIFVDYQSDQLVDAKAFKTLWMKHQSEINDALNSKKKKRSDLIVDVGLDQQGRMKYIDYDVQNNDNSFGKIHFISNTQFTNYGQATAIDRKQLNKAKTFEEVAKGSLAETFISGISKSLNNKAEYGEGIESQDDVEPKSLDEQLEKIALDTFKRTGSYIKSYQAVFVLLFASQNPDLVKYYSTSDLNEIAELHAYYYHDELVKPKGKALDRLNKIAVKHQLNDEDNFNNLGGNVAEIVDEAIGDMQEKAEWKKLMQTAKTPQAAFAQRYEKLFRDENDLDENMEKNITAASKLLAQAYIDDSKDKLSRNSVKNLKEDFEDLLDFDLYRKVYEELDKYQSK